MNKIIVRLEGVLRQEGLPQQRSLCVLLQGEKLRDASRDPRFGARPPRPAGAPGADRGQRCRRLHPRGDAAGALLSEAPQVLRGVRLRLRSRPARSSAALPATRCWPSRTRLSALLALGLRNIRLGPTLPAFLSPSVVRLLVENFGLCGIGNVDDDVKAILA